jgi:hypothetical protein
VLPVASSPLQQRPGDLVPFLNPPESLVQGDDQLRFAFSFVFYPTPPGNGPVMTIEPSRTIAP